MKNSQTAKHKHINIHDRIKIEQLLNETFKLVDIADYLNRDPRGISYEIKVHRYLTIRSNARNKCGIQNRCRETRLCHQCSSGLCKYCGHTKCNDYCPKFQSEPQCKTIMRFPYVCNGCADIKNCELPKWFYKANKAHDEYRENISQWKSNCQLTDQKLKELNLILSEGVKKGISIDVILKMNNINHAPSSIYRWINNNLFTVKNIDLKRKVRYRQRVTNKPKAIAINYQYLEGRNFSDYGNYILNNPTANIWQMDTIEGVKGENETAVLSLLYTKTNLQLYFKLESICREEVNKVFTSIREYLGTELFQVIFECILTDNGKEFKDPLSIEIDPLTGEKLISVFYCESRRSDQKGKCEKNHEHFRECLPKGISLNPYSISHIHYISNQVNNYPRKALSYQSPLVASKLFLPEIVFDLNCLQEITHHHLNLKPIKLK